MKYAYIFFITLLLIGCENTNESSSNESNVIEEKVIETVVEPTASASQMPTEMTKEVMADMKKELEQLDMPEEEKTTFIKKVEKNMKKPAKPPVAKIEKPTKVAKAKEVVTEATNAKAKEVVTKATNTKAKEVVTEATNAKTKEVVTEAANAKAKEVVTEAANAKAKEVIEEKVKPKVAIDSSPRNFINKEYTVKGNWSIQKEGDKTYVKLHSNFKTKNGPDLKVFLHNSTIQTVSSKNALKGSVLLGALKSNKGEQKYLVPNNIDITNYKSVLIHCEKYTVLWGGGKLF